ncbi:alpha/beta hydrolase [Streptomyces sp. SID13031]|uniref:alpha/beta fold hydrolase n=1 Tax=Streptomyces sp. SID13031 TaxID=2706046 RepID=UPI0013C5C45F|nr:alpha/beta hydrolase [Streptomyces sp. SID13031]
MQCTVHTPDGRLLAVEDRGDPAGWPVLVHHGTPSSRRAAFYGPWVRDAADHGLRLISYDRPGYGDSSPAPGRTVAGTVADVRAICAELGIERLVTWGYSGGGPHALACAALLPDLVTAAASLAGLAPFDASGFDWFAGKHPDDVEDTRLYLTDEVSAWKQMNQYRKEFLIASAGQAAPAHESVHPQDDAAVMRGGYHGFMYSCTKAGLAPGSLGWWDDNSAHLRPWSFDLADIAVPVLLMHGRQDILVPPGHSEWLAKHIPGVEMRLFDADGHATLAQNHVPEVHAWLSEKR